MVTHSSRDIQMPIHLFSSSRKLVRFAWSYLVGMAVFALIGTLWVHYEFWGYLIVRPGLLGSAKNIIEVEHLIPIRTDFCDTDKPCGLTIDKQSTLVEILNSSQGAPYSPNAKPLLNHLQAQGKLPSSFEHNVQEALAIYSAMLQSPIIATPDEGYTQDFLQGVVLIGKTKAGHKRAFVSARGDQVANDHYPYYQALFAIEQNGNSIQYLDGQRFFFEVAGIEGFEGPLVIFIIWGVLVLIFGCVPTAFIIIVDTLWQHRLHQQSED